MYRNLISLMTPKGSSYDTDAQAFFTAYNITDLTEKNAVNKLVLDMKHFNIWNDHVAFYPFVGGNAYSHSGNLINPNLYQLNFSSGWTHSSTGATPNGVSAFADTGIIPSDVLGLDTILSYYSRSEKIGSSECEIGTNTTTAINNLYMTFDAYNSNYVGINQLNDLIINPRLTSTKGLLIIGRKGDNIYRSFRGSYPISETKIPTGLADKSIVIGAFKDDNQLRLFSSKECASCGISFTSGTSLIQSKIVNMGAIINQFQTSLGRNV